MEERDGVPVGKILCKEDRMLHPGDTRSRTGQLGEGAQQHSDRRGSHPVWPAWKGPNVLSQGGSGRNMVDMVVTARE